MDDFFVSGVSKSFKKKKVLDNVSFSIKRGEVVGLVGKSGVGKSVFVKLLINFLKPDSGKIFYRQDVNTSLGFSMQENSLYDYLTVKQNLKYFSQIYGVPIKNSKSKIDELIVRLKLSDFEDVLVKKISGGTKKRVDIACSLLNDPTFLIFDEPFLGLDPSLVKLLASFIHSLGKAGKAVLISSHRLEELSKICSRFVLLKDGHLTNTSRSNLGGIYT